MPHGSFDGSRNIGIINNCSEFSQIKIILRDVFFSFFPSDSSSFSFLSWAIVVRHRMVFCWCCLAFGNLILEQ